MIFMGLPVALTVHNILVFLEYLYKSHQWPDIIDYLIPHCRTAPFLDTFEAFPLIQDFFQPQGVCLTSAYFH